MDILVDNNLLFESRSETGVLFHMIGALSQYGKVGVTCFGNSIEEAESLYQRTVDTLDHEVGVAKGMGGQAIRFLDRDIPGME